MANPAEKSLDDVASGNVSGRRAILHLFGEFERARADRDTAVSRLNRFGETIQLLLAGMTEPERSSLTRKFAEIQSGITPRGGDVFNNVVALFKRDHRTEWSIPDIQSELERGGTPVESKALSNAVLYLAKIGRLKRVGRGQYVVEEFGVGIQMDGPDDGHLWATEHEV